MDEAGARSLFGGWMAGWVGGWQGGWMDGRVDGWMDGWVDGWMGGRVVIFYPLRFSLFSSIKTSNLRSF